MFRKKKAYPPSWRFAPTGGGAEQGNSAGMQTFKEDAMASMVREVLQNSLDQLESGLETVRVRFDLRDLPAEYFGARQLAPHVAAALKEAERDGNQEMTQRLKRSEILLRGDSIATLTIADSGSTGLRDERWDNLIIREGAPNSGPNSGGSFGFGKNAPFNVSDIGAVFYSTRYFDKRVERGRALYMMGKAILMSHCDPRRRNRRLQHIGFYAAHGGGRHNARVEGEAVPHELALDDTGTALHILGFSGARENWRDKTARAAIENFFCAIHWGRLEIAIAQENGEDRIIDAEALPVEFERGGGAAERAYYEAIRDNEPVHAESSGVIDGLGGLEIWIAAGIDDLPNRLCYVNRKGMKITDARLFGRNPFYPAGGVAWQPWCAVAMSSDDRCESRLRRLEPPAHNELNYKLAEDAAQGRFIEGELRGLRDRTADLLRDRFGANNAASRDNAAELAELFPDIEDGGDAEAVEFKNLRAEALVAGAEDNALGYAAVKREEETGGRIGGGNGGDGGDGGGGGVGGDPPRGKDRGGAPPIRIARALRLSADEMLITIEASEESDAALGVLAAGEQPVRDEPPLAFASAVAASPAEARVSVDANGNLRLSGITGKVTLKARLASGIAEYSGYRLFEIDGANNDGEETAI